MKKETYHTTLISAGDMESYTYCPLSWWLKKHENAIHDEISKSGIKKHKDLLEKIDKIQSKEKRAYTYEILVPILAIGASIIAVLAIIFHPSWKLDIWKNVFIIFSLIWLLHSTFFLYKSEKIKIKSLRPKYEMMILASSVGAAVISLFAISSLFPDDILLSRLLGLIAIGWLIGASLFFYVSTYLFEDSILKRKEYKIIRGQITYVDYGKEYPVITSKEYGLSGKPDYVIKNEDGYIPVEEKTGVVAKYPFFSHIVQIGVYCILVNERFGNCPYGLLKYGEKRKFEIERDDKLMKTVIEIKNRLLKDFAEGNVHRNHSRKGKCAHCSVREICPEKII